MKNSLTLRTLLVLLLLGFGVMTRGAEIKGTVRNAATGAFLEAVVISVVDQPGTIVRTDREGRFTVGNLSPGEYRVRISYPGSREEIVPVSLASATAVQSVEASLRPIDEESTVVQLERFVVASDREGYAASVARQRAADNLQNVLSMDTYGAVADGNIGNFVQRLAGVSAIKDIDIVGVSLRGTPGGATALTLDGSRFAGVEGDRSSRIDQIPSEFIKEIEVIKGNTPDMWADGLAGTINLVTKSAFDYKTDLRTYQGGGAVNTYRDLWKWLPFGSFTYLTTFGENRSVGLALSASYNKTVNIRDWVQTERRELDARATQARLLDDILYRERDGVSAKLEVKLSPATKFNVIAQTNYWKQVSDRSNYTVGATGNRTVADYSRRSRALIESGQQPLNSAGTAAGVAPGFTDTFTELLNATFTNQVQRGGGITKVFRFGGGLEHRFSNRTLLTGEMSWSHNRTRGGNSGFTATLRGLGLSIDTAESRLQPRFTQTYGPSIAAASDMSAYAQGRLHKNISEAREDMESARVDLRHDLTWQVPMRVQAGAALRRQERWSISTAPTWDYYGPDRVVGRNAATGINDDNLEQFRVPHPGYAMFNGTYAGRDQFDYGKAFNTFEQRPELFRANAVAAPIAGIVNEEVRAGYLMSRATISRLVVTGGLRVESTSVTGSGSLSDPQNPNQTRIERDGGYTNLFPSLHFKYGLGPNALVRASYAATAMRPGIGDITPSTTVAYSGATGSGTVTQNNPDLKPQFADNYDLAMEYYFRPSGLVSLGVFRKDIKDFIVRTTGFVEPGADNGFDGRYAGFVWNTNTNAPTAKVEGVEFDFNQPLSFLPKPFHRLRVFGNYTYLRTQGTYSGGVDELVNFVPRVYNVGGSFAWRKWETRVAYNYKGGFLVAYSTDPTALNRQSPDRSLDVNLKFQYRPELGFYVDVVNLLDPGTYWYNIDPSRVVKFERTAAGWSPAHEIARGVAPGGEPLPAYNPVLFLAAEGRLALVYSVGRENSPWLPYLQWSYDAGQSWTAAEPLPAGVRGPDRNRPLLLASGELLHPSTGSGRQVHVEFSDQELKTWRRQPAVGDPEKYEAIQPTLLDHGGGRVQMLCRTYARELATAWSENGGRTWTPLAGLGVFIANSAIDAMRLRDGRFMLVYNPGIKPTDRKNWGERVPLSVAVSADGMMWRKSLDLESAPIREGFAYPSVLQTADGDVHVTYTWGRKRIRHVVLDPAQL